MATVSIRYWKAFSTGPGWIELTRGEYGIDGVALTVPVTLAAGRAEHIHEWPLSPEQAAAMRAGAAIVREATGSL